MQFGEDEAEELLPTVKRLTIMSAREAEKIEEQLKFVPRDEPVFARLSQDLDLIIKRWAIKIKKLGLRPSGLWIVDFDAGNGWFSWRLGDEHVSYFNAPIEEGAEHSPQKELLD